MIRAWGIGYGVSGMAGDCTACMPYTPYPIPDTLFSMPRDAELLLDELAELAERLDMTVRRLPQGGEGGGLAQIRGKWTLFIDTQAAPSDQLDRLTDQMSQLPQVRNQYVSPALRELLGE